MIIIIISLLLGGYVGYRFGAYFTRRENETLKSQLTHLERFSSGWANAASASFSLTNRAAESQVVNTRYAMETVVQMLSAFQTRHAATLDRSESEEVQKIISQASSFASIDE